MVDQQRFYMTLIISHTAITHVHTHWLISPWVQPPMTALCLTRVTAVFMINTVSPWPPTRITFSSLTLISTTSITSKSWQRILNRLFVGGLCYEKFISVWVVYEKFILVCGWSMRILWDQCVGGLLEVYISVWVVYEKSISVCGRSIRSLYQCVGGLWEVYISVWAVY